MSVVAAAAFSACGGGGGGGGGGSPPLLTGGDPGVYVGVGVQGIQPAVALSMAAVLNVVEPTRFQALQGTSPTVTPSGTASAGSVTLDFGGSTLVANAVWSGKIVATWTGAVPAGTGTGRIGTVTFDLAGFSFTSPLAGGTVTVNPGNTTIAIQNVSWTNNTNVQASAVGSSQDLVVTAGSNGALSILPFATWTWSFAATGAETITIGSGEDLSLEFDNPADLTGLDNGSSNCESIVLSLSGSTRSISTGTVIAVRNSTVASYSFTTTNGGTVTTTPKGGVSVTVSFSF